MSKCSPMLISKSSFFSRISSASKLMYELLSNIIYRMLAVSDFNNIDIYISTLHNGHESN
jgi:hypothetical protein